jgi:subtilisin family serine protease
VDGLVPPAITARSARLAVIDTQPDLSHPDLAGGNVTVAVPGPRRGEHGTAVTAIASAPANALGMTGVWPGMRVLAIDDGDDCGDAVRSVYRAIAARVSVINMSYGFDDDRSCFVHLVATQRAFRAGIVIVASAGNEFGQGNPLERPAVDPHVVTVSAVTRDLKSSYFSNENLAVDVAAPGTDVLTAVPLANDTADGVRDGYTELDGTSFSAPIVSGIATWLRAARPSLRNDQVIEALHQSAKDLGEEGFDTSFGYGLVNLAAALKIKADRHDPYEPNDDVEWVNGRRLRGVSPLFFRAGDRARSTFGRLDVYEDPLDVYRIVLPARSAIRIYVKPSFGDPDLELYAGSVRTVYGDRGLLERSNRIGADGITYRNSSPRARHAYIDVYVDAQARVLNNEYTLRVTRLR